MEAAVVVIRFGVFRVSRLQGIGFVDSSGKATTVPDPDNCSVDLTYFTFRSVINATDIDNRASDKSSSLEFPLR